MRTPNFLIIGAAKCGTDALYSYLAQHPQVYLSPSKEPNFFIVEGQAEIPYRGPGDRETLERCDMWVSTLEQYQALFAGVSAEKALGEGSTWYIYDERAPERIHQHIPHAKLIAILRHPADRAYSAFTMLMRDGRETIRDFSLALAAEDDRVRSNWEPLWHYRRMGFYSTQLKRYYDTFDAAHIRVVLYDDFSSRPGDIMRELFRFLEVDDQFAPDVAARHNVSLVPKHPTYQWLIAGQHPLKTVARSVLPAAVRRRVKDGLLSRSLTGPKPLAPEVRRQLVEIFRPDIVQLQGLIDRDLSHWLQ